MKLIFGIAIIAMVLQGVILPGTATAGSRASNAYVKVSKNPECICPHWAVISPDKGATVTFIAEGRWSPMPKEWTVPQSSGLIIPLSVQCQPENTAFTIPGTPVARECMVVATP